MQKYLFHLIAKFHSVFLALFLDFFPMSCANDATFTQHFHLLCLLVCMCALHVHRVSAWGPWVAGTSVSLYIACMWFQDACTVISSYPNKCLVPL